MRKRIILFLILLSSHIFAKEIGQFTLHVDRDYFSMPISISLDVFNYNTDQGELALYEISSSKEEYVPSQIEQGHSTRLWFILKKKSSSESKRYFILKYKKETDIPLLVSSVLKTDNDLILKSYDSPVLKYRFTTTYPPHGVDSLFKRSGFIHPLYSPGGEVLTHIQAPDHFHHYGIWGPWTKTFIDGREVDFWNLSKGQGTVKFANVLSQVSGAVLSGFMVHQEHIDFGSEEQDQNAINELLDVRVWNVDEKVHIIDYTTSLNTSLKNGVILDAYRYGGGIGFRATEKWTKNNSSIFTSEGKSRVDADGSRARWCIIEGESSVDEGRSGILFLSHPSNRMHPEPMRVWPEDANEGKGDILFNFSPIRYETWELKPLHDYTLKYRMIVFDGVMDKETADMYWCNFSKSLKVDINLN